MAPTVILLSLLTFIVVLVGGVTNSHSPKKSAIAASYNLNDTQTTSATGSARTGTYGKISPTKISRFSKTIKPTEATSRPLKPTEGSTKTLKATTFKPDQTQATTRALKPTKVKPFKSKEPTKTLKPTVKWTEVSTKALKPTTVKPTVTATRTTTSPVRFHTEDLNENIDKNVERRVWHKKESEEPLVFECPPLGLESLKVKDSQIQASSYKRMGLGPHRGRLNIQSGVEDGDIYDGAWCAQYKDQNQWLQVDAKKLTRFTAVILQGRSSIWSWDYVETFKVQVSNDTIKWKPCMNGTEEVVFEGNKDTETSVLAILPKPAVAQYIRINPQTWFKNGTICLRAEIMGCELPDPNNIYPWQAEEGTKDKLDFRHHNYKEMRKIDKDG